MQQLKKIFSILLITILVTSCAINKRFNNEDYKVVNTFLQNYNIVDNNSKNLNLENPVLSSDSIFLLEKFTLTYDPSNVQKLKNKVTKYHELQLLCSSGKSPYIDSLKTNLACVLVKNFESFVMILKEEDEVYFRNLKSTEENIRLNKNKIKNKSISIIPSERFYKKYKYNGKLIKTFSKFTKIEIKDLTYNKRKDIAFLKFDIRIYTPEIGSLDESKQGTLLYFKRKSEWVSLGLIDYF